MALTPQDINRIASLARLELSQDHSQQLLEQLNGFFTIVEKMDAVNTDGVEPLFHPVSAIEDITLRLRDDVASEPSNRSGNMQNAPAAEDGLFLVPKVIE